MRYCIVCGKPLGVEQPYQMGLDGEGCHVACLETLEDDEEDERE